MRVPERIRHPQYGHAGVTSAAKKRERTIGLHSLYDPKGASPAPSGPAILGVHQLTAYAASPRSLGREPRRPSPGMGAEICCIVYSTVHRNCRCENCPPPWTRRERTRERHHRNIAARLEPPPAPPLLPVLLGGMLGWDACLSKLVNPPVSLVSMLTHRGLDGRLRHVSCMAR